MVEAVFEELNNLGLSNESRLVLAGTSAGAFGALVFGIRFKRDGEYPDLAILIDSAWVLDHDGIMSEIFSTLEYADTLPQDVCGRPASANFILPCCISPRCLIQEFISQLEIPTFVVTSRADIFVFALLANSSARHPQFDFTNSKNDFSLQINVYSGAMNNSLANSRFSSVSLFQPGCGQHGYFRNIPLWGTIIGGMNSLSVPTADGVSLEYIYRLLPGYWQGITTNGISMSSSLTRWVTSNYSRQITWESCVGFLCNPSCPDRIDTRLVQDEIPEALEVVIVIVAITWLALPIVFKTLVSLAAWLVLGTASHVAEEDDVIAKADIPGSPSFTSRPSLRSSIRFNPKRLSIASNASLMNIVRGEELQLACRNLTVTVPFQPKLEKAHRETDIERESVRTPPPGKKVILKDIEVQLHTHQLVGLIGPSGSGKTTFLNVLANRRQGYEIEVRHSSSSE